MAAEEARRAEEEARRSDEEMARRTLQTGVDYFAQGRYQMALNVLKGFVSGSGQSAEAWYWISRAHHAMGDYDKAQAAANIALEIDPYYGPLTKSPSGLEPKPPLTKQQKKEPRPSMSVLPVIQPLPGGLALEPVTISPPYLVSGGSQDDLPKSENVLSSGAAEGFAYLHYAPYEPLPPGKTPGWITTNEKFNEIGRWRFRVDRMGILTDPRVPVAWRGAHPYEVYFWTGREWARILRHGEREPVEKILFRQLRGITDVVNREGQTWDENDTPALAASASLMRFMWVGDIDLNRDLRTEEHE